MSALHQGLAILELFGPEDAHGISFSEILRRIDIPRSSTFRFVNDLHTAGYLRRDDAKRYTLGPRVMSLGFTFLASQDLITLARPELMQLRDSTGCSTYLSILDGDEIMYLAHFAAQRPVLGSVTIGTRSPAHATAMGRCMLAFQSHAELQARYGARDLRRYSSDAPANVDELFALLEADRKRGFAFGNATFSPGVMSIAAPLAGRNGRVAGAISAASLDSEHTGTQYDTSVAGAVRAAAHAISALLS